MAAATFNRDIYDRDRDFDRDRDRLTDAVLARLPLPQLLLRARAPTLLAARGEAYSRARDTADEHARLACVRASLPAPPPVPGRSPPLLGDRLLRCTAAAAPLSVGAAATEAARCSAWAARMQAAHAQLVAAGRSRVTAQRAALDAAGEANGATVASLRHVPTLFGFASGRRRGPRPSDTLMFVAPRSRSEAAAIEALVRERRFLRFGDFLTNCDSLAGISAS